MARVTLHRSKLRCRPVLAVLFLVFCGIRISAWTSSSDSCRKGLFPLASFKQVGQAPFSSLAHLPPAIHTKSCWITRKRILFAADSSNSQDDTPNDKNDSDDDDDGWGDISLSSTESSSQKLAMAAATLESIRAANKQRNTTQQQQQQLQDSPAEPPERDLFIPIFTLVAVTGFAGLYAYESLRLYLNGELYLPGSN